MAAKLCLPPRLADGEVVLDSYQAGDAEAHFAGEDEEMRRRFEAPGPSTPEQTRNAILGWSAHREPSIVNYALRDRAGRLLGGCEARRTSDAVVEVSYWVFPDYRGLGLAARALSLLADALKAVGGLERIEAHVDADNHASQKAAKRAGFVRSGDVDERALAGGVVRRRLYVRKLRD
jgi:RimJ/RimL family protein N-acetyltransferase